MKKDAGFAYANWCREWHQISAPRRDSLNPRGKLARIVFQKEGRLDGRKLLLIFGNRINSTLVKWFKEGLFCVRKLALGMAPNIRSAEGFIESAG